MLHRDLSAPIDTPLLVAHCDWSTHAGKRWVAVGSVDADGTVKASAAEPVGDTRTLLARLRGRAAGARVVAGFDFPIGVPQAFAERAGIGHFPGFLRHLASQDDPSFFSVAEAPEHVSVARPFYPARPGSSAQQHLVDGLGVPDMHALLRTCERPTATRRAASSLFWLVGGAQVGKAAIAGWREVLLPALDAVEPVGLWPYDGPLDSALRTHEIVLAETYPTEFSRHLHARPGTGGKRQRLGRAPACRALEAAAHAMGVALTPTAADDLASDFGNGPDGEDRFDAFMGLLGMLAIALGHREAGPPAAIPADVIAVEGWILGQALDADVRSRHGTGGRVRQIGIAHHRRPVREGWPS